MVNQTKAVVAYCRFSSHLQREESIEAQLRAIHDYTERNNMIVVEEYIDRAKTATSDDRPEFQRMIADSARNGFVGVVVHKLDRFSRDRYNSAHYKRELKRNGVRLYSVLENLDDSPESVILESVLEGFAEYYSKNLAREVEKGKRENALKCQHVGGMAPLGYNISESKRYVINEWEAEAVRLIFRWVLNGKSYDEIIGELNRLGYKGKRGNSFTKNGLYSILKNEKYYGLYTYNRSAPKSVDGKRNGHATKPREEWITVEGGVPAIISKDEFEAVQHIMSKRMQTRKHSRAKTKFLLTGKIVCGVCGGSYVGSTHHRGDGSKYTVYGCNRRYRAKEYGCTNKEISKAYLEGWIIDKLSEYVFSDKLASKITAEYNRHIQERNYSYSAQHTAHMTRMKELQRDIDRVVSLLIETNSNALTTKLRELEAEQARSRFLLEELESGVQAEAYTEADIREVLSRIRGMLKTGTMESITNIIEKFVACVTVNPDDVIVRFNFFPEFTLSIESATEKDCPICECIADTHGQSISRDYTGLGRSVDSGGEGGI